MGKPKCIVIGAGVSGLAAAANLASKGCSVTVLEKNSTAGGRASTFEQDGFLFDKGPSWFWMPEVMETFFTTYGHRMEDYFTLKRLDPSYRVYFKDEHIDIPANFEALQAVFEQKEPGAGQKLKKFMDDAAIKYNISMRGFIDRPSVSIWEYMNPALLKPALKLNLLSSFYKHARKYFSSSQLLKIIEFPVLFLGGTPHTIPAMYSLMNYGDTMLGTWYPMGGFSELPKAMESVCKQLGVVFNYNEPVQEISIQGNRAKEVLTNKNRYEADIIISAADYHHTETALLSASNRSYTNEYWDSREMAPSAILFFLGLNTKLTYVEHHNLFFEPDFYTHAESIYNKPGWPEDPLFYLCCPSKTDPSVAPAGMENVFILIPVNYELEPSQATIDELFAKVVKRIENVSGLDITNHIVVKEQYTRQSFINDYHSFKGNAYGLSNTLKQTAFLKPSIAHKKVKNLFYCGQLTVPGPGIPPSIISGKIASDYALKKCIQ